MKRRRRLTYLFGVLSLVVGILGCVNALETADGRSKSPAGQAPRSPHGPAWDRVFTGTLQVAESWEEYPRPRLVEIQPVFGDAPEVLWCPLLDSHLRPPLDSFPLAYVPGRRYMVFHAGENADKGRDGTALQDCNVVAIVDLDETTQEWRVREQLRAQRGRRLLPQLGIEEGKPDALKEWMKAANGRIRQGGVEVRDVVEALGAPNWLEGDWRTEGAEWTLVYYYDDEPVVLRVPRPDIDGERITEPLLKVAVTGEQVTGVAEDKIVLESSPPPYGFRGWLREAGKRKASAESNPSEPENNNDHE